MDAITDDTITKADNTTVSETETTTGAADDELLAKLNKAVAAANKAEATVETAKTEFVSRSKTVGMLLLEAKKLHPKLDEFEAFLKQVHGLSLSWAYDQMKLAGGRTTHEELKRDARERKRRSRAAKRKALPKAAPALRKPEPISVTPTPVTETSSPSTEQPDSVTPPSVTESQDRADTRKAEPTLNPSTAQKAAKQSAHSLAEFKFACDTWLPKITVEAHRQEARRLVAELLGEPKAEAA